MSERAVSGPPADQIESVVAVMEAVRRQMAATRPEIVLQTGLGRNVVTDRVEHLLRAGLLAEGPAAPSTGGRAPRGLRFRAEAGYVLTAELGASSFEAGIADLSGTLLREQIVRIPITDGPERVLGRAAEVFAEFVSGLGRDASVWGVGIGLPGPVEFETGLPVSPPIMPGWDGFDVRGFFAQRFGAPVWVDNEVNMLALGELRAGAAGDASDFIYVKVGTGIGAGLVSGGRLHRGAKGCAGDIGHIAIGGSDVVCRCGQLGCLEAVAGGFALGRDAQEAAETNTSSFLATALREGRPVGAETVVEGAQHGDPVSRTMLTESARLVGETPARLVNFFNPSLVLIGGHVAANAGDLYLAEIRQTVFARSLPLATRSLQILPSPAAKRAGLRGAAFMAIDALLAPESLAGRLAHDR